MNKEWSELNKLMQTQIKKKDTYDSGITAIGELIQISDKKAELIS